MADIRPFRGIRYNASRFGSELSFLVCPPFDVITPNLQRRLVRRHPRNMVRLELPSETANDAPGAKYQRAASQFGAWLADGTLVQDSEPALYVYSCRFSVAGIQHERRGLFALVHLEPWERGIVRPHERTLAGPKQDRLQLMRACEANFSPIWLVYRGAVAEANALWNAVSTREPDISLWDSENDSVRHSVWACTEPLAIRAFQQVLADRPVYVADGHHRYETALGYRDELEKENGDLPENAAPNFVLAHMVQGDDPGLPVLGIQRLVRTSGPPDANYIRRSLNTWFDLHETESGARELLWRLNSLPAGQIAFAVYAPRAHLSIVAVLKADIIPLSFSADHSEGWRRLDAAALHALGIDRLYSGGTQSLIETGRLTYAYSPEEVEREIETSRADIAFLLRGTPVEQVMAVADAGDKMPEKSTYFYPKPVTGLVMAGLKGEVPIIDRSSGEKSN